jgi:tetratricopeptide (TPR) repeat protein
MEIMGQSRIVAAFLALLLIPVGMEASSAEEIQRAKELYQRTEYQAVLRLLDSRDGGAEENALIGKAYYQIGEYKKATESLERAIEKDPKNSDYYDWLGKIYGKRAETSSILTAWSYAPKCRRNFERAIELDPKNIEAIDDLFEFSIDAPGMVGGGLEKAASVVELARTVNVAKYHSLQARLAEKQKDFPREETHLRKALEFAPSHLGRILDMAEFLARRARYDESEAMFERAKKVAPASAELKFERAKTYIATGRNRKEAKQLLEEYLNSSLTPDDPPRSEAQALLKKATSS